MKKRIIALLLAAAMVFSLTACSSSGDSGSSSDSGSASTDGGDAGGDSGEDAGSSSGTSDVTLTMNCWDSNQLPGLKIIMEDFTAETGIGVESSVVVWEDYWTQLQAAAQGGGLADVFWMHAKEADKYMMNDILLDLTDYIAESEDVAYENYPADLWNYYTYEEHYYAVPKDFDTIALWYNKTYFDEAGLDYPDETWTWEDLYDAAETLTTDEHYGMVWNPTDGQAGYYNTILSMGGSLLSGDAESGYTYGFDDPNTIKAMEYVQTFFDAGLTPPVEVTAETNIDALLSSGTVAMAMQGSWMLASMLANEYACENLDVAVLPMDSETGNRVCIYNGLGWTANAGTEHPEEAWQLIEYMTSKDAQIKQADLGVMMSAYNDTLDGWVTACEDFDLQGYVDMFENVDVYPVTLSTTVWETKLQEIITQIFGAEVGVEEGCLMVDEAVESLIEENG